MKNRKMKITMLALLGFIAAEAAMQAQAADITVVNRTSPVIHPYYRSNCWDTSMVNVKPNEWAFFGGIRGNDQFTWPAFDGLLKAGCKKPVSLARPRHSKLTRKLFAVASTRPSSNMPAATRSAAVSSRSRLRLRLV